MVGVTVTSVSVIYHIPRDRKAWWNSLLQYVISRRLKQSVLLVGSQVKSESEFQAIGPATENGRKC